MSAIELLELGLIPLVRDKKKKKNAPELSSRTRDDAEKRSSGYGNANANTGNSKNGDRSNTTIFDGNYNGSKESPLVRISIGTNSSTTAPVVIGRRQLLTSFRAACKIPRGGDGGGDPKKSPYRKTVRWGVKALSREMLRFSGFGMQIRGKHAVVRVNSTEILSSNMNNTKANYDDDDEDDNKNQSVGNAIFEVAREQEDGWSINPVKIKPGDILSLEPRVGQGILEFCVIILNHKVIQNKTVYTIAKSGNTSMAIANGNGNIMDESTDRCDVDLIDESKGGQKHKRDEILLNNSSMQVVALDGDSKKWNLNTANDSNRIDSIKLAKSSLFLVYFFPFGNGFSASRRQKLEHNLEILGATILDDIWKAKYIVISESIRSLAVVAKRMCVEEECLIQHLEKNIDIRCVLPSWADYCISSVNFLVIPSRIHTWCYSQTLTTSKSAARNISVKRNRDAIRDNNEKQTIGEDPPSRKKVISNNDSSIQTRRECCFHRNVQVAEAFKTLSKLHQSMSLLPADTWKSYSFQIVAGRLLELNFEVANDEETKLKLRSIKGFGKSVCEKIQECIEHGTISRIQEFKSDPQRQAMKNLKDIWGVGIVRASDLMDRGYRTIDDVRIGIRQNKLSLDRNQLVGVDCYEDILDRMSRSEAEEIGETVRVVAESLFPGIETSIMGSYRRGKAFCGDVDIQLTHPAFVRNIPTDALGRIIDKLWNEGKIAMHLTFLTGMTTGTHYTDYQKASQHVTKDAWERTKISSKQAEYKFYMGCLYSPIKPRVRRRVDIKFYPYRERAFATLYFTGNGYFNRSMRLWASRVFGFKLSDQGLFDSGDGKTRVFEASTEREIFDRLQLIYREPHERLYWDAIQPFDKDVKPDLRLTESELKDDNSKNQWVD